MGNGWVVAKTRGDAALVSIEAHFQMPTQAAAQVGADAALPMTPRAFRPEYVEALILLAMACDDVARAGYERPMLVGGAAVEFHTGGSVTSGDFDFFATDQRVFEQVLISYGFKREDPDRSDFERVVSSGSYAGD
jgi:hypothetical protein